MGATASSLPDTLSESDFRSLCGDSYNPVYYTALKNPNHAIQKEFLLLISQDALEKEIFQLYLNFIPTGEMVSKTYIKLLKDTKSLHKNNFTSGDADILFQKYKTKYKTTPLNYYIFRNEMIPEIIQKKNMALNDYLVKLSKSDGPVLHATQAEANRFHDDKSTYTGVHTQGGPSFENSSGAVNLSDHLNRSDADVRGVVIKGEEIEVTNEHHNAAIKLQTVQRSKNAKKQVEAIREIQQEIQTINPDQDFSKPTNSTSEQSLQHLFLQFCSNNEMDSKTFIKFLRDCNQITKKFTTGDADLIFQKTKAKASAPGAGSYSSGVVHGKRVNYEVFRAIAIPSLAEKKGISIEMLINELIECNGPSLNNVTAAQANKFHDDVSTYTGARAVAAGGG